MIIERGQIQGVNERASWRHATTKQRHVIRDECVTKDVTSPPAQGTESKRKQVGFLLPPSPLSQERVGGVLFFHAATPAPCALHQNSGPTSMPPPPCVLGRHPHAELAPPPLRAGRNSRALHQHPRPCALGQRPRPCVLC